MASFFNSAQKSGPDKDTGWGLIFRLNKLWSEIETAVETGHMNRWNFKMDRIFVNICYRENMVVTIEDQKSPGGKRDVEVHFKKTQGQDKDDPEDSIEGKKIINIDLSETDKKMFNWFKMRIAGIQSKIKKEPVNKEQLNSDLYEVLTAKDIWLRKLIFKLKLYLTEHEYDPRRAIYGG